MRQGTVAYILIQREIFSHPPLSLLRREYESFTESSVFETALDAYPNNDSDFLSLVKIYA